MMVVPGDVELGEEAHHPAHVEARLAAGQAAAEDEVLDLAAVELGDLVEHPRDHRRGEVVGPQVDERALQGAADGRPAGGDDDGFGHELANLSRGGRRALTPVSRIGLLDRSSSSPTVRSFGP